MMDDLIKQLTNYKLILQNIIAQESEKETSVHNLIKICDENLASDDVVKISFNLGFCKGVMMSRGFL